MLGHDKEKKICDLIFLYGKLNAMLLLTCVAGRKLTWRKLEP
jgi:hypothetical protein